jgi:UDP-glucose 4-epimerase
LAHYLVSGGAGFIGSTLVRFLLERGEKVRVLDNFSTGKRENLEEVGKRIEIIEGDLCDGETVARAVKGVDYVLHQAAIPSVPRSVEQPLESHASNATGTLMLLLAARDEKVQRVVYASSSSAYGASEVVPKLETMATAPLSPYAVAKLAAEQYCLIFHRLYGLETVALRYFNVFGPRQDPNSPYTGVVSRFIDAIRSGHPPVIYGDGEQTRDFTFVDNVAQANWAACHSESGVGRAFNIGCGGRTSINELWNTMAGLAEVDLTPNYEASRLGDVRHSQADVTRAKQLLGFEPKVGLSQGLETTLVFYGADRGGGEKA